MLRRSILTSAGLLMLAVPAFAQTAPQGGGQQQALSSQERQFLDHVAKDNQGEINLALMAEKQAGAPAVKAFARLMVNDHVAVESQLAAVLNALEVKTGNGGTKEDKEATQKLRSQQGSAFDQQFMADQIKDHQGDIRDFNQELQSAQNPQVRSLVDVTLPMLRQHLALAQAVQHSLGGTSQQTMAGQAGH
jgi:putative membrane protein